MTCPEHAALEAWAEGDTSFAGGVDLDEHLASCVRCRRMMVEIRANLELVTALRDASLDGPDEPHRVREIGRYTVIGELGRGGMGIVYHARDPHLERSVAIKVLPGRLAAQPERLARFRQEARVLAALSHPNIATVFSLEEDGPRPFITMERVEGRTLETAISGPRLSMAEALSTARQIAAALDAAHVRDIAHRDLKPHNVVVNPDGLVKVLDFGLAKILGGTGTSTRVDLQASSPEAVLGTPGYMSPEQLRGSDVDSRTDVWSFGCVLYELLTGSRCFPGATPADRVARSLSADPDWSLLPAAVPERVRALIAQCLRKETASRLGSMAEARRILDEVQAALLLPGSDTRRSLRASEVPNNLPLRLSSFVGREAELEGIQELLEHERLVTLTGVGGCGKSRLALELAHRVLERFPDGVHLVQLAPVTDPDLVPRRIAGALGVTERSGQDLSRLLTRRVQAGRLLLLLDNCEHLLGAIAALVRNLVESAPSARLLTTSREGLGITGERIVAVRSLPVPDADAGAAELETNDSARLFLERARSVEPSIQLDPETLGAVTNICRRLDGMPLALELAAARAQALPVVEISRRLDDRFRLLSGGSRTALPRHQTLKALIDWSHDQLGERERVLFRRLAVFSGGWTLDALEAVCAGNGLEDWELIDLLTSLAAKSLVERDPDGGLASGVSRYRLLETVRQYARDRLLESGEAAAVRSLHAGYYLTLIESLETELFGPGAVMAGERFEADHDNLLLAMEPLSPTLEDGQRRLRLAGTLGRFWGTRGYWAEGRRLLEECLLDPLCTDRTPARAKACNWAGNLAHYQGDYARSESLHLECRDISRETGDRFYEASSYNNLGTLANYRGDVDQGRRLHERSLALRRGLGIPWAVSLSLYQVGTTALRQGRPAEARAHLHEGLALARAGEDALHVAAIQVSLGLVDAMEDDFATALERFDESLALHEEFKETWGVALARHYRALALRRLGRRDEAVREQLASLDTRHRMGDVQAIASSLDGVVLLFQERDPHAAARLLGASNALRESIQAPRAPWEATEIARAHEVLQASLADAFDARLAEGAGLGATRATALARLLARS